MITDAFVRESESFITEMVSRGLVSLADIADYDESQLETLYRVGCSMLASGAQQEALALAGTIIMLDPSRADGYRLAGISLHQLGQLEFAAGYYEMALQRKEDDPLTLLYFGEVLIQLGRTGDGLTILDAGIAGAAADVRLIPHLRRARSIKQLTTAE